VVKERKKGKGRESEERWGKGKIRNSYKPEDRLEAVPACNCGVGS